MARHTGSDAADPARHARRGSDDRFRWRQDRPHHHHPDGGFRNPWLHARPEEVRGQFFRWRWERIVRGVPPAPRPGQLPLADSDVAYPAAAADELRVTWIGHSTFLLQFDGLNVLTDPVWSRRASPVRWGGPARLVPPGLRFDRLPQIHAVLVSHDHYDHLDHRTVQRLARRFGDGLTWFTPLGYRPWLRGRGAGNVVELDWWHEARLHGPFGAARVCAAPAQHWARRSLIADPRRLWASYTLETPGGRRIYFAGDTGYFPVFRRIGRRLGPFDLVLLPIGAYEPQWFMQPVHLNPEEALRAYHDLGGRGALVPMHWGTFRLSDEHMLEPPRRLASAWRRARLPDSDLWILRHGETRAAHGLGSGLPGGDRS